MNKNPYYIEDNAELNTKQLTLAKQNNYYVFKALNQLYKSAKYGEAKAGGPLRPNLLLGRLRHSDQATGVDTHNLAEKLKFLTIALDDPTKQTEFKNSFLYKNILIPLAAGTNADMPEQNWSKYQRISDKEVFKNKSGLDGALYCQKEDLSSPLGLDYSKLIDCFVKTDINGNYYLEDSYTLDEEIAMTEAVFEQIKALKSNAMFKANYANPSAVDCDD